MLVFHIFYLSFMNKVFQTFSNLFFFCDARAARAKRWKFCPIILKP